MKEKTQDLQNKRGEIIFRRKLYQQHVEDKRIFDDEYTASEMREVLRRRMDKTRVQMRELLERGVKLSPFIELGAERGQRSLVMTNDFGAQGFAVDLSFDSLKATQFYADVFGMEKLPICVCCDAYNLPFRNQSIPFVFCYQTLHHFPDPSPIIREILRVMASGFFFFDEEPFKRGLNIRLYKRKKRKRLVNGTNGRGVLTKVVDALFSETIHNEGEYGIVENEGISCKAWRELLGPFDCVEAVLESPFGVRSALHASAFDPRHLLNRLMGGNIRCLCEKTSEAASLTNIWDALGCPNCRVTDRGGVTDRAPLWRTDNGFRCSHCGQEFPIRDGVIFLFAEQEMHKLYPEIVKDVEIQA